MKLLFLAHPPENFDVYCFLKDDKEKKNKKKGCSVLLGFFLSFKKKTRVTSYWPKQEKKVFFVFFFNSDELFFLFVFSVSVMPLRILSFEHLFFFHRVPEGVEFSETGFLKS